MTEADIRAKCRSSPDEGCAALFGEYYDLVYAIAFRRIRGCGTREDVEECVADVFLAVLSHLDDVRPGGLRAYVAAAAHNKALGVCRALTAKGRQTVSLDSEDFGELAADEDIALTAEERERTRRVLDCIEQLGYPDSAIILQKYYLDRRSGEIARALGMNPATVRSRLSRAMKRLRELLTEQNIQL